MNTNIQFDKEKLLNNFINFKKISNFGVMSCYKALFTREGLIHNIGSYILLLIILLFIVAAFLFYFLGYPSIKKKIKFVTDMQIKKINKDKTKKKLNDTNKEKYMKKANKKGENKINYDLSFSKTEINLKNSIDKSIEKSITNNKQNNISESIKNQNKYTNIKYVEREINLFSYEKAKKHDKRSFLQYYISLIKLKNILLFSFYPTVDYNSMIIKILLFFFSFGLYFAVNALFFNDSTMHNIYSNKGIYNFIYYIPQILYSVIISSIINSLVKRLSLSEKNILEIKQIKNLKNLSNKATEITKCLFIKFIFFFIISFMFLILFWYYLSCFCAVFKKTQKYLIKDTLISFSLSLIYPFILCLIPAIMRFIALNKPGNCIYKISKFLQFL